VSSEGRTHVIAQEALKNGEEGMKGETEKFPILQVLEKDTDRIKVTVVRESPLTIFLNNQELVTLLCSPTDLRYLAVGFLLSEGLIKGKGDIKKIIINDQRGVVRVETHEEKDPANELIFKRFITSGSLAKEFQHYSRIYKITGGIHSAALCDTTSILIFAEDIGRHNAIDKILGQCLLEDIPTGERMIITSGRISSEILLKVAKRDIPIVVSKSAPTNLAVRLANDLGITLIGFVRGKRMNAYTNDWRIVTDGK
jgi:FdhD protein